MSKKNRQNMPMPAPLTSSIQNPVLAGDQLQTPLFADAELYVMRAVFLARGSSLVQKVFQEVPEQFRDQAPEALKNLCESGFLIRKQIQIPPQSRNPDEPESQWLIRLTDKGASNLKPVLELFDAESYSPLGLAPAAPVPQSQKLGILLGLMSQTVGAAMLAPAFRVMHVKYGIEFLRELVSEIQGLPVIDSWKRVVAMLLKERERVQSYADKPRDCGNAPRENDVGCGPEENTEKPADA